MSEHTRPRRMTREAYIARLENQHLDPLHWAAVCPICGTVQSRASLNRAGGKRYDAATQDHDGMFAFACEGRLTGAGHWPGKRATAARRAIRGCNWSLGGLLKLHEIEVEYDGVIHSLFRPASREEAQALFAEMKGRDDGASAGNGQPGASEATGP